MRRPYGRKPQLRPIYWQRHRWTSQIIYHTRRRPALRRRRNAQVRQARCRLLRVPSAAAYSPHPPAHICQAFCMRHSPDSRRWAYCQGRTFLFPRPRRAVFFRFPSMLYRYSRAHWGCRSPEVPSYLLLLFSLLSFKIFLSLKNFSLFTKRMMQAFAPSLFVSLILLPDKHSAL